MMHSVRLASTSAGSICPGARLQTTVGLGLTSTATQRPPGDWEADRLWLARSSRGRRPADPQAVGRAPRLRAAPGVGGPPPVKCPKPSRMPPWMKTDWTGGRAR